MKSDINNVEIKEGYAVFRINPKIYPLDVVYSAAYIMIDKSFILLDGNPESEILAEIRKKDPCQDINELVKEFNDQLLNYAVYKVQSEKNKGLRETILQRVLMTNAPKIFTNQQAAAQEKKDDKAQ